MAPTTDPTVLLPDSPAGADHGTDERVERRGARWPATAFLVALMAACVVVHDPHRMLDQPLWRDENWLAVTTRAPLTQVFRLTSTTPVLFTVLLRVTPHGSPSGLRILPLAFTVASVVPAWLLGRALEPGRRLTAVVLAVTVAFAPALVVRHDLKQYTAEACTTLVILWLLARLEQEWTRRRLVGLAAVLVVSTLLSNASMFLGAAVLVALALVAALRRDRRRLVDLLAVGAATAAADLLVLVAIDQRGDTPTLRAYWDAFYVPLDAGWADAVHFLHYRAGAELQNVGLGPSLVVAALVVAGLATLVRLGFPALALVVPITTVEQLAAAGAHRYPLWDPRTSTWFTILLTVVAMTGVVGLVRAAVDGAGRLTGRPAVVTRVAAGALVAALVVGLAVPAARAVRLAADTTTPLEDVHGQVETILAQARPGDVVVANVDAGFGLGVYWPAPPEFLTGQARLNTFRIAYPPGDRMVVATTISTPAEVRAVHEAVAEAAARPGARVWVVFSHWHVPERRTMTDALLARGTLTTPPGQHGLEQVQLLTLRPGSPSPVGAG